MDKNGLILEKEKEVLIKMKTIDTNECHSMFGNYIKTARMRKKVSQCAVAEALGISQSYLSYIEMGKREIDLALAFKLCDVLELDMRDFINKHM